MKGQYAVIGLGRFGSSLATTLHQAGNEVLAIDRNEERIEEYKDHVTYAVVADSTDEEALKSVGIRNFDAVIVAIGDDIQASILTVLILKELEVKKVVAKAINKRHGQVLYKVGADWVVFPERDMGERVATQLMSPNVLDYIELAKDYSIKEVKVPPSMIEKNLRELNLRARFNITVIAIISDGKVSISPSPDRIIKEGDILVVIGENKDLDRFEKFD
ncbi:TrkA family potassium uptake protein [Parageobacillus toebii NBRC 107807]|jgi:trk system potassium uptake protein|uniref:Trk system potassium uptake protein TrkA n=1 Tax=Parageobacillus toebii NBRC 107807 TaxID=1223503 RepID=A0A6G9J374_9BACL|nr:TrkA family potassium uptake protein [Parageobacillus toebii]MBB3868858.1 trk system potassium uptake protein TrkA [Parageobacillus toebii NBRC 107807]OQP02413.1 potassium uptake system protein [Geobacillus sp. 44C]QIQ32554.1 TrkA family potassium uptake protein [Parageobacillus toebii NBRC 107807]QNU33395.1 TrkA family potassium uptake protein [Geobacillus sp. 44C]